MNYTLNQLQIFHKITQTMSVTKAAAELHLTQPAVSIQLKNFQDQFDTPLTEVVGRKIYITDFGKKIAQSIETILDHTAIIDSMSHTNKGQLTGRLKLSIVSTGQYVMPFFLPPFMKEHQSVELIMDVTNRSKVIESLEQNLVDFSLVSILPTTIAVEKLDLIENKLFLVGNRDTKFQKVPYSKQLLKELPLIFREKGSGTREVMESFIERSHLSVIRKMELTSNEAVKQAVVAGLGYSIMPLISIESELQSERLQIIPLTGLPIKNTWRLIWLKGKKHSPAASAFLEYMRNEKKAIAARSFSLEA